MDSENIQVRPVQEADWDFWQSLDVHLPRSAFLRKVRDQEGYVLRKGEQPIGVLRYHLFWDTIPFCTFLYIRKEEQRKGYGTILMEAWAEEMMEKHPGMLMTSTQVNEDAQHFYRKLGFSDCGGILFPVEGFEQPMELVLCRENRGWNSNKNICSILK